MGGCIADALDRSFRGLWCFRDQGSTLGLSSGKDRSRVSVGILYGNHSPFMFYNMYYFELEV